MLLYVVLFYLITGFTRQNNQLTDYVCSAEVDTWIRLRIALFLGATYGFREGYVGSYLVEDEVKRS